MAKTTKTNYNSGHDLITSRKSITHFVLSVHALFLHTHTCNKWFDVFCQGDEEKQAGARRGQHAAWRPVRHPAAVVPDETHEEQTAPEGELSDNKPDFVKLRNGFGRIQLVNTVY